MNKDTDYAYTAGLLDGEGSISITPKLYLSVKIRNTDKPVLLWLQEVLHRFLAKSGGLYKNNSTNKQCFSLEFNGKHAKSVLEFLLPYLRIKKRQAELAIEFQSLSLTPDEGNYYREQIIGLNRRNPYPVDLLGTRKVIKL